MRIRSVEIENIRGIVRQAWQPGTLTLITGDNGEGKSGITDGLNQLFSGGHNPKLLRKGCKVGKVVLRMEGGQIASMTVTKRGTTYEAIDEDGEQLPAPRSIIEKWASEQAVNPTQFLRARPQDLQKIVAGLIPIDISREDFNKCLVGDDLFPELGVADQSGNPFPSLTVEKFDALRKQVYETRTKLNAELREATGAVDDLSKSLPAEDESGSITDWVARERELAALLDEGKQEQIDELQRVGEDLAAQEKAEREKYDQALADLRARSRLVAEEVRKKWAPQLEQVSTLQGEAKSNATRQAELSGLRRQLDLAKNRKVQAATKVDDLTTTLRNLDDLKVNKSEKTIINGLENREGELYFGDLPLDSINMAQRVAVFCAISEKFRGELPFMFIDGGEMFGREMLNSLYQWAETKGLQIVLTKVVDDSPLNIEVLDRPQAA